MLQHTTSRIDICRTDQPMFLWVRYQLKRPAQRCPNEIEAAGRIYARTCSWSDSGGLSNERNSSCCSSETRVPTDRIDHIAAREVVPPVSPRHIDRPVYVFELPERLDDCHFQPEFPVCDPIYRFIACFRSSTSDRPTGTSGPSLARSSAFRAATLFKSEPRLITTKHFPADGGVVT
jgi:hypothetical protein